MATHWDIEVLKLVHGHFHKHQKQTVALTVKKKRPSAYFEESRLSDWYRERVENYNEAKIY